MYDSIDDKNNGTKSVSAFNVQCYEKTYKFKWQMVARDQKKEDNVKKCGKMAGWPKFKLRHYWHAKSISISMLDLLIFARLDSNTSLNEECFTWLPIGMSS